MQNYRNLYNFFGNPIEISNFARKECLVGDFIFLGNHPFLILLFGYMNFCSSKTNSSKMGLKNIMPFILLVI